jgi:hypothetical protein
VSYRWKPQYPGSQMLCNRDGSAFNVILIGRYSTGQLKSAVTNFSNIKYPPAYRLSILLDANTSATLQKILDTGPFDDISSIHVCRRYFHPFSYCLRPNEAERLYVIACHNPASADFSFVLCSLAFAFLVHQPSVACSNSAYNPTASGVAPTQSITIKPGRLRWCYFCQWVDTYSNALWRLRLE